jgi:hypothetical protein
MISVYIHLFRKAPESATPLSKGNHQASGTMKTKELSKQVRDKVVEKYRSGLGYKKLSEALNILLRTIKSILKKMKGGLPGGAVVPPETLGSRPGSVVTGMAGRDVHVSSRTSDSRGRPGAVRANQGCQVFPPAHWCGWLPGWMRAVLRSSAAWLGCVSEEA